MSKVRKYQGGTKVEAGTVKTSTPKYKILVDGKEVEFTDEELDRAWSDIAVKNILKQGGTKEDDLNARYVQFKDQAKNGTYNFDVAPSQTLSGDYEGGNAQLGTDKKIRGIDKVFGIKNEGKQMNMVNYYLPMQLKQISDERDASVKSAEDKQTQDAKSKFETDTDKKYASIAKGYGYGALAFGDDYMNALSNPEQLKSILNLGYWNKDEAARRDLLTKSGAGLKDVYNMSPEEIAHIETKYPGFSLKRERILKYYNPEQNQFNFSNLPKFQDLYEYSNAQDAMEQDKYLFDANTLKSKEDLDKEKETDDLSTIPSIDDLGENYVPVTEPQKEEQIDPYDQIMNDRTEIDLDKDEFAKNSLITSLFPSYKPGNKYFVAWHTKGGTNSGIDKYWVPKVDANGNIINDAQGDPILEIISYDWKNKKVVGREQAPRDVIKQRYAGGYTNPIKEDLGHRLLNVDKGLIGEDQKSLTYEEPSSSWALGSRPSFEEGGILKAQQGMVFKYRDQADIDTYLQKIQQEKGVDLPTAQKYFSTWVNTGKIKPIEVKQQEIIDAPKYGEQTRKLDEWHSQSLKNVEGWDSLSSIDKADIGALIGDIGAIALPGPIGQISGLQGAGAGLYADVKRDGLDWGDVGIAAQGIGTSALSLVPGLGQSKLPMIAKTLSRIVKSKTAMPIIRTALTGISAYGALKILDKGINQGFENLTLEDMRLLGAGIMGLKNTKNITQKQGVYKSQPMGENRIVTAEINTPKGIIKHKVVLSPEEVANVKRAGGVGFEGKTQAQVTQEIIHGKIQKDATLSKVLGNEIKATDISIPTKTTYGIKGIWSPKQRETAVKMDDTGIVIEAPTTLKDTKLAKLNRFLYTGDPNAAQFKARELPKRGQETVYNPEVTTQRIGKNTEGKFIKEGSTTEINAKSKIKLDEAKYVNERDVHKLIDLPKLQNAEVAKLTKLRTPNTKEFSQEKKKDVDKIINALEKNLQKAKKASSDLDATADPDMKRNLKDLIKNQESKLNQLKQGIKYQDTQPQPKLLEKQSRMNRQKQFLQDYAQGKTTPGKNPLSMEKRQQRPEPKGPKGLLEKPFEMKPTGADKAKRGRSKKKLELGGVLKFWPGGIMLPSTFNTIQDQQNKRKLALEQQQGFINTLPGAKSTNTEVQNDVQMGQNPSVKSNMNFASGQTKPFPKFQIDPIWGLKAAELLNNIRSARRQDTNVNVPIAQQMQEYVPTVTGSQNLEQGYTDKANTQRTFANLPQTADAGINLQQRSQLESKLRDFESEGRLKGLMLRQQSQEKKDQLITNYNQQRQQVQNMNIAQSTEGKNQERANKNLISQKTSDLLSEFMQNKAQVMQNDKLQNEGYQQKLSELQLSKDIEDNPIIKKNMDEFIRLTDLAQKNNGVLSEQDKLRLDKLRTWKNQLYNEQLRTLYSGKVAGKPYEAGTFQFNQEI